MIGWLDGIADWDRGLPVVLILAGVTIEQRRDVLHALVVRCMELHPDEVVVDRPEGRPPVVAKPIGSGLHLSLGRRSVYTVAAVAAAPIGVDVELVDEAGEVPWNVLHASEMAMLAELPPDLRAAALARLWSLKEAYLKALGIGLSREPSSFSVRFADDERAVVHDSWASAKVTEARTAWRQTGEIRAAVSAVLLERSPG